LRQMRQGVPYKCMGRQRRVYRVFWRIVRQQNSSRKAALPIIFSKEDLHKVIEATLAFFEEHGKPGERFGNTLDRVGWDLLKNRLEEVLKAG